MFSLYFSPETGRVPELFTTCVIGEEDMANKKTRKVRALAKARPLKQKLERIRRRYDPDDAKERCQSESFGRTPAV